MESLLLRENGGMNAGRSSFAFHSNNNNIDGGFGFGFGFGSVNYPLHHPLCLTRSMFDPNINRNFGGSFTSTARPLYSSLPPVRVQRQPPLLPLPIKSATLPSSNIKIGSSTPIIRSSSSSSAARQNRRKKKNQPQAKLSTIPKERAATVEIAKIAAPPKPAKRNDPPAEEEEDTEEEFLLVGSRSPSPVYSLSPPPSSVPLPKLLLMRPRPTKSAAAASARSCIAEAVAGGMDLGATDDHICRLLRI